MKLGDKAKVIVDDTCADPQGHIGIITKIDNGYYYAAHELEVIPKKIRGFQRIIGFLDIPLPTRATRHSAGYDLRVTDDITLAPGETKAYTTGLCAYMQPDEVLEIHIRSSIGIYSNVVLSNGTSIIDSDYIQSDNGGHIMIALTNTGNEVFHAPKGDRVAQGIFHKYLVTDDDNVTTERNGGWGSTGA